MESLQSMANSAYNTAEYYGRGNVSRLANKNIHSGFKKDWADDDHKTCVNPKCGKIIDCQRAGVLGSDKEGMHVYYKVAEKPYKYKYTLTGGGKAAKAGPEVNVGGAFEWSGESGDVIVRGATGARTGWKNNVYCMGCMAEGKVGNKENSKILLRNIVTSCETSNYVVPID